MESLAAEAELISESGTSSSGQRRGGWQIRLRWSVAPVMITGMLAARALGFELQTRPILLITAAILGYNALLVWASRRYESRLRSDPKLDRLVASTEIAADYVALFLLIYFTGGVSSPLVVFLIFHIIISAVQLSAPTAYALAGLAAGGLWLMLLAQLEGWTELPRFAHAGQSLTALDRPAIEAALLLFFTTTLFIAAWITSRIARQLRARIAETTRVSRELAAANARLRGLSTMVTSIGAERRLDAVLAGITAELSAVADVPAVAVKLLDEDRSELRYVAAHGLPAEWLETKVVHLDRSPLNQRCIDGETLVSGSVDGTEPLELRQELEDLGYHSAVLVPLKLADRVIGTLSFYSPSRGAFAAEDTPFLRLAGELVAIAIENARAYEAIERILRERAQSMLEVAHNLRAPLGAGLSMLELLTAGYLGELNEKQAEPPGPPVRTPRGSRPDHR